jgi:hypothetical protein
MTDMKSLLPDVSQDQRDRLRAEHLLYRQRHITTALEQSVEALPQAVRDMEAARTARHDIDLNEVEPLNMVHLAAYIGSLGGRLRLVAEFPDDMAIGASATKVFEEMHGTPWSE